MDVLIKVLKILWILIVLGCAGVAATFVGAISMDAPSTPNIVGVLVFLLVFCIILFLGTMPLWLVKIGKKDAASVLKRKKMNKYAIIWSLVIALFSGGIISFFLLYVLIYTLGLAYMENEQKHARKH